MQIGSLLDVLEVGGWGVIVLAGRGHCDVGLLLVGVVKVPVGLGRLVVVAVVGGLGLRVDVDLAGVAGACPPWGAGRRSWTGWALGHRLLPLVAASGLGTRPAARVEPAGLGLGLSGCLSDWSAAPLQFWAFSCNASCKRFKVKSSFDCTPNFLYNRILLCGRAAAKVIAPTQKCLLAYDAKVCVTDL